MVLKVQNVTNFSSELAGRFPTENHFPPFLPSPKTWTFFMIHSKTSGRSSIRKPAFPMLLPPLDFFFNLILIIILFEMENVASLASSETCVFSFSLLFIPPSKFKKKTRGLQMTFLILNELGYLFSFLLFFLKLFQNSVPTFRGELNSFFSHTVSTISTLATQKKCSIITYYYLFS